MLLFLIKYFIAAYVQNVILMRCSYFYKRLLTTTLFYFHLSFFFQKTIPLQEVTDVRKAKTAAIFHNAIEIIAGTKRVRNLSLS